MRITPEILKDYLLSKADAVGAVEIFGNTKRKFKDIRLPEGEAAYDAEYLYLMTPEQYATIPNKAINAILPDAVGVSAVGKGYCLLTAACGPSRLLNLVRACFHDYSEMFEVLYRAIAVGEKMEAILEKSLPLMNNPIFIDDSSYRTLARLKDYPTDDFCDNEYIFMQQSGHHSADYIYAMLNSNVAVESSAISPRPIVHRFEFLAHRTLYSTIKVDGEIVGFFSCVEIETTFTPGMMDISEALTEMWSVALSRQANLTTTRQKSLDNDLFLGILNGSINDPELTKTAFSQVGLTEGDYFVVYIVTDVNTGANPFLLPRIMELLVTNLESSFTIADGSNIVLAVNRKLEDELRANLVRLIGFYLGEFQVTIGISLGFSDPEQLPMHYDQALAATRLGPLSEASEEGPRVYGYDQVVGYDVLERFGDLERRIAICHPAVFVLLNHDKEKRMNLLPTLKVFVECLGDTAQAAERLYLHRNSLYYRLKQIVALTGIDLANEHVLSHITLSLRILQINGDLTI